MRYAPPGLCLNDFAVLGPAPYVLLHLQGPWTPEFDATRLETSYGRARSDDLVTWEPLGPAFGVGLPGRFDDSAVWTMHPFPHEGGLAMAYTGTTFRPDLRQAIGMAFSDRTDGTGWRRAATGPVTTPDPRWYRAGPDEAWRDPWVVAGAVEGARWAMLTAARTSADPVDRAGCVGLATSDDLCQWEIHPPALIPGGVDELECPILEPFDGGWLMLASLSPQRHIAAWWAEKVSGPWEALGPIAPAGVYAPRLIDGPAGERLVLHTVPRRVGLRDDGALCRGMLAQPKVLRYTPAGPRLAWWPGLERALGAERDPAEPLGDALVEVGLVEVGLGGRAVTVGLRGHLLVTVTEHGANLVRPGGGPPQTTALDGVPTSLRILSVGEYIEVYADDILVLSGSSYGPRTGPITVQGPSAPPRVRSLLLPDSGRDDVSALWP